MAIIKPISRRGALGLAGAAALAGRARADNPAEVKIAMEVPLSGPWARSGLLEQMGARMAVDDLNAAGGIKALGGAKLKLIEFDAGLSTFTLAITEVTERAQLPWLTLSYSDLITGRGFKYVFQSSPTADAQSKEELPMIIEMAEKATGKKPTKFASVGDNTAASVSFMKTIRSKTTTDLGLTLVADEVYTPPLADAT